ncbi:MAG: hypothetical protein KAH16_00705 [Candidatus Izimaplasma sp.]|nr:hypothetical protein [Candidatus Izimaplasma bacterium]
MIDKEYINNTLQAGTIGLICEPNAIMILTEYLLDYAETIKDQTVKDKLKVNIDRIINGERDLFF